jgi:hypothetical protein
MKFGDAQMKHLTETIIPGVLFFAGSYAMLVIMGAMQ